MKTLHWNRTWSYNPQNTFESRRNQAKRHETLEKQGCQAQNALKITIIGIGQGRRVVGEDCQQPTMLEEEARHRRCLHAPPPPPPPHALARGEQGRFLWWRVWLTCAPSGQQLGGLDRRRPTHLLVWAVSPHAPSKCVFQNTNL